MNEVINFSEKLSKFSEHWQPKIIARLNDYEFKLVKVTGEFVPHTHPDTDEAFLIFEGTLDIVLPDRRVTLRPGEMFVVPKGVEHQPVAAEECHLMLIEPKDVPNTGDVGGNRTAPLGVWI